LFKGKEDVELAFGALKNLDADKTYLQTDEGGHFFVTFLALRVYF
jgi:transposase